MGKWNPMKQNFDPAPATLADFLLARIAEDEVEAPFIHNGDKWSDGCSCDFPERWLAECETKRRIVKRAQSAARWAATEDEADYADDGPEYAGAVADAWHEALLALALPYAGHPDWREEWRP